MALSVLGAASVFDFGSTTAEAATSVGQLAGTYVGADPRLYASTWTVTISDDGRITGVRSGAFTRDKISGSVGADGRYSLSVSATILGFVFHGPGPSDGDAKWMKVQYKSSGTLVPNGDGNLVGTGDRGESFLWVRQ
jgi:hypothetical protein